MKDSDRSKLDDILSRHDRRMAENAQREVNEAKAKEEFVRVFIDRCMSVIRPAMMEIGDVLKDQGHDYKIVDNLIRKLDGSDLLKIDLQIINNKNRNYSAIDIPHISFAADRSARNVRIEDTTKDSSSSRDDRTMTIEQITTELVQGRMLRVVDYAFR